MRSRRSLGDSDAGDNPPPTTAEPTTARPTVSCAPTCTTISFPNDD